MKKLLTLILALCVILLAGCGDQPATTADESAPKESLAAQTLDESSAPETVVVPDVVGMDKDEAVKKLEDLGLKVELKHWRGMESEDGLVPHNAVYEQNVSGGVLMGKGETIKISYSTHENGYLYDINDDGTITINFIGYTVFDEETGAYIMPKIYDGYVITAITESAAHQLARIYGFGDSDHALIKLPKGVKIEMLEEFKYEEY